MIVHTWSDGGSKPDRRAAAAAIIQSVDGTTLTHRGLLLPCATNNVAEWEGLRLALEAARDIGATHVVAHLDSELVARQFTGEYRVNGELRPFYEKTTAVAAQLEDVRVQWVPRARNAAADALCNKVLNGTYNPDGGPASSPSTPTVRLAFVVEIVVNPKDVRDQVAAGADVNQLARAAAAERSARLLRAGVAGDVVEVKRIAG